ncbi:hypothetical protein [Persicobacter psychrovividus]|uniref:HTH cro/C1-type domain-containing protein n=1 Tax=Persicobacter psychrovividus TaxID=387638 RepID=A0ABM7VLV8_9BACT|nr:hypothetical protein PEPS_42580 [Persicobacter psychrovividus]
MRIKNDNELDIAIAQLDLFLEKEELNTVEHIFKDALTDAIEAYEDERFSDLGKLSVQEYLLSELEEQGLQKQDLIPYFGSKQSISNFFAGKHPSKDIIARLVQYFNVPATLFFNQDNYPIQPITPTSSGHSKGMNS